MLILTGNGLYCIDRQTPIRNQIMDEKTSTTFRIFDNQKAFTLVELIVVVAVIAILSAMGSTYFSYLKFRAGDSQAFVEGRHLLTAVNDAMLDAEDIEYIVGAPGTTGPVGDTASGGVGRSPVYTLSNEIWARLTIISTPDPGGDFLLAKVWSINGSKDSSPLALSGKKEYTFYINEAANVIEVPKF